MININNQSFQIKKENYELINEANNLSDSTLTYTKLSLNNDSIDSSSSNNSKTFKDLFISSKLYFKYLSVVKSKINNLNIDTIKNEKTFLEHYNYSINLLEEINKEWFWISNGDVFNSFRENGDKINEIKEHKKKFSDNCHVLESIAKYYGYDKWMKNRHKLLISNLSKDDSINSINLIKDSSINLTKDNFIN
jgi:hypothetical protein